GSVAGVGVATVTGLFRESAWADSAAAADADRAGGACALGHDAERQSGGRSGGSGSAGAVGRVGHGCASGLRVGCGPGRGGGGVRQQVNLYVPELRPRREPLLFRQVAWGGGGLLLILLVIATALGGLQRSERRAL